MEVQAVLGDETRTKMKAVRALVDTGATLTAIPRQLARELGIKPHAQARVKTGAGVIVMDRARAYVEIMGAGEIVPVLISDVINRVLVGVTTLEVLELEVDPVAGALRRTALLLYSLARV